MHYIYFTEYHHLYTLYINIPGISNKLFSNLEMLQGDSRQEKNNASTKWTSRKCHISMCCAWKGGTLQETHRKGLSTSAECVTVLPQLSKEIQLARPRRTRIKTQLTSKVTQLRHIFYSCQLLHDETAVMNWPFAAHRCFHPQTNTTETDGRKGWKGRKNVCGQKLFLSVFVPVIKQRQYTQAQKHQHWFDSWDRCAGNPSCDAMFHALFPWLCWRTRSPEHLGQYCTQGGAKCIQTHSKLPLIGRIVSEFTTSSDSPIMFCMAQSSLSDVSTSQAKNQCVHSLAQSSLGLWTSHVSQFGPLWHSIAQSKLAVVE